MNPTHSGAGEGHFAGGEWLVARLMRLQRNHRLAVEQFHQPLQEACVRRIGFRYDAGEGSVGAVAVHRPSSKLGVHVDMGELFRILGQNPLGTGIPVRGIEVRGKTGSALRR